MIDRAHFEEFSYDELLAIDAPCANFEQSLRNNTLASIECHLEAVAPRIQTAVFRELLAIELEWRIAHDQVPDISEYQARFPANHEEIRQAFFETGQSVMALAIESGPSQPSTGGASHILDIRLPRRIGRYELEKVVGRGSFGLVYRAHDDQLNRVVAIKVPHDSAISRRDDLASYLAEARTVASLDHPNIVPVFDVGGTEEFPCYVVSKYIDGTDLATRVKRARLSLQEAVGLVATVAEALHHAHKHGLVHRDIKPGNILLDRGGKAFICDFGLVLREEDVGKGPRSAGTPAYMSPEQARGEGHRVDGRSDIFSLGSVFYELLVGRPPYRAHSRAELMEQVTTFDPRPPRQFDDAIPKEVDRICLKALAKRASERYSTAKDMADDLRHFLSQQTIEQRSGSDATTVSGSRSTRAVTQPPSTSSASGRSGATSATTPISNGSALKIVPKGLRSFDARDADFFLELVAGPRDRDGLPDSIRFWKSRIEEMDPDATFAVGLLYGPSGCGKSSLIKAGLLPRLSGDVIAVYVEATAAETEPRLLNGLRKRCPALPTDLGLKETLAALRRGQDIPAGKKVLIILDQFEQWLHANKDEENTELVQALRQCDGGRVQCILMVRDDFWLAVSRFLKQLEVRLLEGENSALADLFDMDHARKILAAFGRAVGKLPEDARETSKEQKEFLKQAVSALAQEGKVISVRLALFADMMKGRPWTHGTLKEVGGAEGVGVTFLEETFSAATAPPEHRYHQKAARAVLKSLLPEAGSDIMGHMRSYAELLEVSGYAGRAQDFVELVRILDSEVRLITPTDPEGKDEGGRMKDEGGSMEMEKSEPDPSDTSFILHPSSFRYYQLTHDYLVPSLREWLTRKQKETRRGRAELLLAERAAAWTAKRENRHVPSVWEWGTIQALTGKTRWTKPQRQMMRQARRLHLVRWAAGLALVLGIAIIIQQAMAATSRRSLAERTRTAVSAMANSRGAIVPRAIEDLEALPRDIVLTELRARFADSKASQKLALACALAHFGSVEVNALVTHIHGAAANEVENLVTALGDARKDALEALRAAAAASKANKDWRLKQRLAVVALHLGDLSLAQEMCQHRPDPIQRTIFIDQVASWQGDASRLATFAGTMVDPALRSGISLGIGSTPAEQSTEEMKQAWQPFFADWYEHDPDKAVHSAAGWALRHWQRPSPEIAASHQPAEGRQWHVNSVGMSMLKIPAGSFTRKDDAFATARGDPVNTSLAHASSIAEVAKNTLQKVSLTRPFLLCDREVSVGLFQQFADDPDYPASEKVTDWLGADSEINPTAEHPVQEVEWNHALLFCNWLSRKEALEPCYERTGKILFVGGPDRREEWRLINGAGGYRLPTEAECEYACRAGTVTQYSFGDEEGLANRYAVQGTNRTQMCGSKLPNGWGLFDLHGNVMEWCQDCKVPYGREEAVSDPMGQGDDRSLYRIVRGGSFNYGTLANTSSRRDGSPVYRHTFYIGFRVARTVSP